MPLRFSFNDKSCKHSRSGIKVTVYSIRIFKNLINCYLVNFHPNYEAWCETVELKEVIAQVAHALVDIPENYFSDSDDRTYCNEVFQRYPGC